MQPEYMENRTYKVGINNRNAPSLYRTYNVPDHLFPYESRSTENEFSEERLQAALERFGSLLEHKLNIADTFDKVTRDIGEHCRIISSAKTLYKMLVASPDAREVTITLTPEERQIYLCRNYLTELHEDMSHLANISVFQTCCNYLRYIPCGIGQMQHLKMLVLSRNRLIELPDELGLCRELREIDVSYNLLTKLPRSLASLRCLNTLHITGNKFTELPAFLGKISSLKYLNVGNNEISHIPLEIFKLPFLLTLSVDNCPLEPKQRFTEIGTLSLREITTRHIIKNNMKVSKNLCKTIREYILSVQECSFCGGPFFENYVEIFDVHTFESVVHPVYYRMCSRHYSRHSDRLRMMFENNLPTVPSRLIQDRMPSVTELFEPYCLNDAQTWCMNNGFSQNGPLIPLISLAKYNSYAYRKASVEKLLSENAEDFNIYD